MEHLKRKLERDGAVHRNDNTAKMNENIHLISTIEKLRSEIQAAKAQQAAQKFGLPGKK